MNARPQVALVTGANRGLDLETCRQLLAKGPAVVMAGRDEAALARARTELWKDEQIRAVIVRMGKRERGRPKGSRPLVCLVSY